MKTLAERFWAKVIVHDDCWEWTATTDRYGYGVIAIGRHSQPRVDKAHRVSWVIHFGSIPDKLDVLHECDNPPCTKPAHLFLGTHGDNMRDMTRKGRNVLGQREGGFGRIGEAHPRARITEADVIEIRRLHAERAMTRREIAALKGISISSVKQIVARNLWKHI